MSNRIWYLLGTLVVAGLLGFSIYLQMYDGFKPCPLCALQRIAFLILGISFLFGFLFYRVKFARVFFSFLGLVFSASGLFLSGRQVWLQHHPSASSGECGVSLQYMLQVLPVSEVAQKVFQGSAECTEKGWQFLMLNMAEWSLVCFAGFFILAYYLLRKSGSK